MAKSNKRNTAQGTDHQMVRSIDDLREFEEFQTDILPQLRNAIKNKKSAEDIYKMVASAAAGKLATLAIKEQDPMKALSLIKEVLDRSGGKSIERRETKHELANIADEELDQLIESQLQDEEYDSKEIIPN